jgi:hypothetical protein
MLAASSLRTRMPSRANRLGAIVIALAVVWIAALLHGAHHQQALSDFGTAAAALGAAAACGVVSYRSGGRIKLVWGFIAGSALAWGLGECVWTWYEIVQAREVPFPSLADVGYLAAVPLAAAGMLLVPIGPQTWPGRVRALVDGVMIACSALLTSWVFVLGKVFGDGGSTLTHTIAVAYPIGDVVVVTIVLYVWLRARRQEISTGVPLALIGLALVAMAFSTAHSRT